MADYTLQDITRKDNLPVKLWEYDEVGKLKLLSDKIEEAIDCIEKKPESAIRKLKILCCSIDIITGYGFDEFD